jgi:hypothetical protein
VLLLSWALSSVQESLEALFKSFFPEELLVLVLVNEIVSGLHNIIELVSDILHGSEQLELIFDLNQVVTRVGVNSWHLDRDGDEIIQDLLDDISDASSLGTAFDRWVKNNFSVSKVNLDVEHWWEKMVLVVRNTDLVSKVLHRGLNGFCDSSNDQAIDVVLVRQPSMGLLVWLDMISSVLQSLVDFFTVILDVLKSRDNQGGVNLLKILWEEWLQFSLEKWLLPGLHHLLNLLDVILHLLDKLILVRNN